MKIGEKIKQRRLELDWSLRELSDRMGYANHSTVARIEAGSVDIPQSKIVKFAEVLNVPVSYLMGWDEATETKKEQPTEYDGLSEKRKALMQFAMSVPEDKTEMILQVMKTILKSD